MRSLHGFLLASPEFPRSLVECSVWAAAVALGVRQSWSCRSFLLLFFFSCSYFVLFFILVMVFDVFGIRFVIHGDKWSRALSECLLPVWAYFSCEVSLPI